MDPQTGAAWALLLAASRQAAELDRLGQPSALGDALHWRPGRGWVSCLAPDDPRATLVDLYLPLCSATPARPITVGHLGQSLDGFIATHTGDSQFVTGAANIVHLHRMRALSDAVVVGAGTVAADNPQLTTRHVEGPNPLRIVFDPSRRLEPAFDIFRNPDVPTLYVCAKSLVRDGESRQGTAEIAGIDVDPANPDVGIAELLILLHARGCHRVFVEGGGVTVSTFLQAGLLDRLHVAIAPLLIGDGRPAIRLAPQIKLRDCRRPDYRVFRMGGDVLFDCNLHSAATTNDEAHDLTRVI